MNLSNCVSFWSRETFLDAFNNAVTFKGKINPFAEVTNSGVASQRRILEIPASESIPQGRVIMSPESQNFIVGAASYDFWNGDTLRHKYPILPVDYMGAVGDVGETLASTQPDLQVYAFPYFVRREIDEQERSSYFSGYEVYFSQVKSFDRGDVVSLGSDFYRLKTDTWIDGAGFAVAQAVKIEDPLQVFDIVSGRTVYNPATDSYSGVSVLGVTCFVETLKQNYEFVTNSFTDIEAGDKAITVLKSDATLSINDTIGDYKVLSIRDSTNWVTCQCRKEP